MDNTIITQGSFTSTGLTKVIPIRSDLDWMIVYNFTNAAATDDNGTRFTWLRGMADFSGIIEFKAGGVDSLNMSVMAPPTGFHLFNSGIVDLGARTSLTSISAAAIPLVTVASTAGLVDGDVVRIENVTGGQQLGGYDFQIDVQSGTTFQLINMAQIAAATTGWYRKVNTDLPWYPKWRFITKISLASSAVVTTSIDHGFTVGQEVRLQVPEIFGMVQANQTATIIAITPSTFTLDINSSAFTPFVFPTTTQAADAFSPAIVVPVGENTAVALQNGQNILADATRNTAQIGMMLPGGENSPGGAEDDVMYWIAGKSFSVTNEL